MKKKIILMLFILLFVSGCTTEKITKKENEEIDNIISEMTLNEKVEQMIMVSSRKWTDKEKNIKNEDYTNNLTLNSDIIEYLTNHNFGGFILFGSNIDSNEQVLNLNASIQNTSGKIPKFIGTDEEGGYITRLKYGTTTIGNMALGAINNSNDVYTSTSIIASELSALGFNLDFGPVVDVNDNPSNPVIGVRSFSSDANLVSKLAKPYIKALKSEDIISVAKHFPGHGNTDTDSHVGLPLINKTYDELINNELLPFNSSIDANVDMIMTAHIMFPNIEKSTYKSIKTGEEITLPATLSKTIITDMLRNDMGYDGVVITDALEMDAINEHFDKIDAAKYSINAGVDILLMPIDIISKKAMTELDEYINGIIELVNAGEISIERINESIKRILILKMKRGILNNTSEMSDSRVDTVGSNMNHNLEFELAKKSVTIVKNDNVLPLNADDNTLVLTSSNNEINSMKYGLEKLVNDSVISNTDNISILTYIDTKFDDIKSNIESAKNVVITSKCYNSNDFNPSSSLATFIDEVIKYCHDNDKKVIVISLQLPYDLAKYQDADALLAVYLSNGMNEYPTDEQIRTYGPNIPASMYTLFNTKRAKGTLPVTIYKLDDEYNYTNEVLYEVGYKVKK